MLHISRASKPHYLALPLVSLLLTICTTAEAQNSSSAAAQPSAAPAVATTTGASNREQDGLVGPVRRARTETSTVSNKDGKLVESERVLLETTTYDLRGNRTDNTYYAVAGSSLTGREVYKYDTKGNIIEMTVRDADEAILNQEVYSYEFDAVGNWTKMTTSVAVIEAGKLTYEPAEVTYRTISYYRTDAVMRMISSTLIVPQPPASATPQPTKNTPTQPGGENQIASSEGEAPRTVANNTARLPPPPTDASSNGKEGDRPAARLIETPMTSLPPTSSIAEAPPSDGRSDPKALRLPMPVYPEFARSTGISGMVRVEIVIDENGKVTSAHALSGPAQLHQAAVKAALRAKFSPAMRAGKPVKITAVIGYNFVPAS